ncbi:MAG: hypothetical protein KDA91_06385 [Planctomycetaceae bacterium]|nr:hypothetical protein [Planctomycetaceae bacterium]
MSGHSSESAAICNSLNQSWKGFRNLPGQLRKRRRASRFNGQRLDSVLEQRIVPATIAFEAGVALGLSNFLDNESLLVEFADESNVRFTLGGSAGDTWQAVFDPGPGVDGIGTRTLTIATSVLSGSLVHVGELNSNGLQLAVVGSGFDQPFPFSFQAGLLGELARVDFPAETRFLGGLDVSVGHYGNYSFEQTVATSPISFGGPIFVEGNVNFRSSGELRFDHDFTLTGPTGAEAMSVVAEQIVVDANVQTVDPDGPGGVSVTASIQMLAAGEIFLNGTVSTGDVVSSTPDPIFSVIASGVINLRSGHQYSSPEEFASILGTQNGRLVTGNATNTAGGPAYSGSITVESIIGAIQLPAVDAITTGDAITVPVEDQNSFTGSGDIRIHSREGIYASNASGALSIRTGLAMASTGAGFDDAGYGSLYQRSV